MLMEGARCRPSSGRIVPESLGEVKRRTGPGETQVHAGKGLLIAQEEDRALSEYSHALASRMFRFERRLRRRSSQIARLGRQGFLLGLASHAGGPAPGRAAARSAPATSCGSHCVGGRLRKGGGALRVSYRSRVFRYARNASARSGRESANSTVALRKPSFSPVSWRRPSNSTA